MADQPAVDTPFNDTAAPVVAPVADVVDLQPVTPTLAFQVPDAAKELVGEGKKYSTAEDALNALPHQQSHITKLEDEMATLREDIAKRKAAEDVLQEINKIPTAQVTEPQFDPSQLDALIENKLIAQEQAVVSQANVSSVVNTFVEQYGSKEKAEEAYIQKAAELGLSVDHVNSLAATSPKAVFNLFGMNVTQSTPTKLTSNVNSEADIYQAPVEVQHKTVMGRSTHKEDMAAWKASAPTE